MLSDFHNQTGIKMSYYLSIMSSKYSKNILNKLILFIKRKISG